MGQLVTTVAGGLVGFMIGGPLGASIGMTLGGMIGSTLFGPTIKGPRLTDLKVSASTYGVAIPEIYGTVRVGGNMIWTTGLNETKKKSGGGKGGPKQTTYSYDCSFAMALCKGPITDLTRIWADGKLIFDKTNGTGSNPLDPGSASATMTIILQASGGSDKKKNVRFRLYRGDETQLPDSLIEADKGAGNVSAHRGIAYVVFEKLPLEDFGNRVPQLTFEVTKSLSSNYPNIPITVANSEVDIGDVGDKRYIPDWETGRMIAFDIGGPMERLFDLNTMQQIYEKPSEGRWFARREAYVPGDSLLLATNGGSNSAGWMVTDARSLSTITTYGGSTTLPLSGRYDPDLNPQGSYSNNGELGYGHFISGSGRGMHVIMTGGFRATWAFTYGNDVPIFKTTAPWVPKYFIEGKVGQGESQTIAFRYANNRIELVVWSISASAAGIIYPDGSPLAWRSAEGGWGSTEINIQPYAGEAYTGYIILYDPSDDHLYCQGSSDGVPCVFKYSLETGTYKFKQKHVGLPRPVGGDMRYSRLSGGTFGYVYAQYRNVGKMVEIDLQTGDIVRNEEYGNVFGSQLFIGSQQFWDDVSQSILTITSGEYRRVFFGNTLVKLTLPAVVSDICLKTNVLTASEIDVSGLNDDTLVGYLVDRQTTARDLLKQLGTAFLFDGYESDYKLKFRSRGDASQVTVDESYLGRDEDGITVKETLTQELEMPMRISVTHYDITRDHQQGVQSMKRLAGPVPTMWSSKDDSVEIPIVWTPDEAKQCADKLLKMAWANRVGYTMTLPWKFLKYDPTDVITVTLDSGTTYVMRLTDATIGGDFVVETKGVSEKAAAYVSTAVGNAGSFPQQQIGIAYPSIPVVINTPLLRDTDYDASTNALCYMSVATNALQFDGALLFMREGIDYKAIGSIDSEVEGGYTLNALPATTAYESTDEDSVLQVRLTDLSQTLESVTQEEMLDDFVNAALVGDEVIQFRDAEQQADGSWHLSGILRARRGTNYAVNTHEIGDRFLMLSEAAMTYFYRSPAEYVTNKSFKSVPSGTLVEDAIAYPADLVPRDLMPYTPEDIKITDDGTDVTITMSRRSRVTAPLTDGFGTIHYKEGEKVSARITYKAWPGKDLTQTATGDTPSITGNIPLFDSSGNDLDPSLTFPLTDLDGETTLLFYCAEVGAVEGTPKWVAFERLGEDRWNKVEFY